MNTRRDRASSNFAPLIALAALALGVAVAIHYWRAARVQPRLSAEIVGFAVKRESDEARTPPVRESLAATVAFGNEGEETKSIAKARFFVSSKEDLSVPRSWSMTTHRDSVLLDLKVPPGRSVTHTFIIPWTGREETLYFPDGSAIHLGFSISANSASGEPITRAGRFGYVIQEGGLIAESDHQPIVVELSGE